MTSLDFGPLVLGGNTFGWTSDRAESFAVLDAFFAAGGRAIDTADVYSAWAPGNSGGESETVIGEWLNGRGRRDDVVLASKVAALPQRPGLSGANVRAAVDESLRRLQTDHLDLCFAHVDDPDVAQEEYVSVFDELVRAGKVREVGASNFSAERLASAVTLARATGLTPFTVSQDEYNLIVRDYETGLRDTVSALGMVEVPYSGLASGFLTGKYRPGTSTESARADDVAEHLENPRSAQLLAALDDIAAGRSVPVAAIALAWLRQQPTVAAPIASARTTQQLRALVQSFDIELTPDELARLT